ncbi:MAG: hypothetical protein Q8Q88_22100 [Phenylobacterium sp.]|uniref:hypothetical protein n=1 Tax=Phenylobacterium sp. TaxID=1871053 RepID=UPI0027346A8C|nr:hypothetical protein [Phenylobacterium sp.]MDP3749731.1 hypothetical protein [Phenylobacterium sp.]
MGLDTTPEIIWFISMTLVSLAALRWGGGAERVVAVANLAAWLASRVTFDALGVGAHQWGVLLVDIGFLAVLLVAAARADRTWILFAASFQLLGVVIHVTTMVDPQIRALTYMRGLVIWSYLILVSMAVGTWLEHRRRRRQRP